MKTSITKSIIFLFSILSFQIAFGVEPTDNDDKRKVEKQKMRKFKKSLEDEFDSKGFSFHQKTYVVNGSIDSVWNTYMSVRPNTAWNGELNQFEVAYSKNSDSLYLSTDTTLPPIELGMVYRLNLRIMKIMDVKVCFQISEIDQGAHIIEFTYGKDNKSHGKQRIIMTKDGDQTIVIHYTYFKSSSKIRDKYFYPMFHEDCIDEFHQNLFTQIEMKNTQNMVAEVK